MWQFSSPPRDASFGSWLGLRSKAYKTFIDHAWLHRLVSLHLSIYHAHLYPSFRLSPAFAIPQAS
jgi:hypothetical protein